MAFPAVSQTLHTNIDTPAGSSANSGSWTPGSNELCFAFICCRGNSTPANYTTSITGNGLTWVKVGERDDTQNVITASLWRALGASPSTGAITVNFSAVPISMSIQLISFSGVDTTGTNGSGAVTGFISADTGATDTTPASPGALSTTRNDSLVFGAACGRGQTYTKAADFTNILVNQTASSSGNIVRSNTEYKQVATSGSSATASWSLSSAGDWIAFAVEILSPGGTVYNQSVEGTVTSSGDLVKSSTKVLAGTITSSGALQKAITHLLAGVVTSAGNAGKVLSSILAGVVTLAGDLTTAVHHNYTQALSGSVSSSGSLQRTTQKTLAGTVTSSGSLVRSIFKALTGIVSLIGSVTRQFTTSPFRQKPPSTIYRQDNLSFLITAPVWGGSSYFNDVSPFVQSYEHSSAAVGGFYNATLSLRLPLTELEDWLENSVGRQVQVKGRANTIAWEGIINRVSVNVGGYNMTVGPYTDICNRVKITYSIFLQLGGGNATGIRVVTDYVNDTKSQLRYGILEKNFSTGGIESTSVDELQAMLLSRYAYPPRSEDLNLPGEAVRPHFDIKIECIGYMSLFEKYTYNSATTGTQNLSAKLAAIIAAEPNGLFSSSLTANTLQVPAYENDDSEAWGLIKELVLQGDVSVNRYSFGVYENRRVLYKPVSNQIVYIRPFREGISVIQDSSGGLLQPWQIRPGNYIWVSDLITGKPVSSNLNDDRRIIYADTVQYRMPDGLVINGAHHFRVEQRLAQLGISGLG